LEKFENRFGLSKPFKNTGPRAGTMHKHGRLQRGGQNGHLLCPSREIVTKTQCFLENLQSAA